MSLAISSSLTTEVRKFAVLSLVTDLLMVESVAIQQIKQLHSWNNNYAFAGHAFVTRNSNQTTRRSPPGAWTAGHKTRLMSNLLIVVYPIASHALVM